MASVNLSVVALCKPDEQFPKMKKIWDACKEAGVDPPDEVGEYFDWEEPVSDECPAVEVEPEEFSEEMTDGWEISLDDLPEGAHTLQIRVSY